MNFYVGQRVVCVPRVGELQDIADGLGGATEGSEEMEQLARIGEVLMAYDAAVEG